MNGRRNRAKWGATIGAIMAFLQVVGAHGSEFAHWSGTGTLANLWHIAWIVIATAIVGFVLGLLMEMAVSGGR